MLTRLQTVAALLFALLFILPPLLIADSSGTYSNTSGSYSVDVSVAGGIHGDYKVTFKDANGERTVAGTPDGAGGAGDVLESDEATIYEWDDEGNVVSRTTYRIRNGRVEYRIGDQTTWRRMRKDAKRTFVLQSVQGAGVEHWLSGDDTIGALPDGDHLNGL